MKTEEFYFHYGSLALALAATLRNREPFDRLQGEGAPERWLHAAGLMPAPTAVSVSHVDDLLTLRRAIKAIALAVANGTPWPPDAVAVVNRWAAAPLATPQLDLETHIVRYHLAGDPMPVALATIARDAVDLFGGPQCQHIKKCRQADCSAIFLDMSPGRRRQWCSMDRCGSRAKNENVRRRQAGATSTAKE